MYSSSQSCRTATGTHMPHGIMECYLPPGRGDIPAITPSPSWYSIKRPRRDARHSRCMTITCSACRCTGVNPAGDAGDTSPNILVGGRQRQYLPQYYYVLSDIADQYWLPSVRSASSRFHSAIRRHQFNCRILYSLYLPRVVLTITWYSITH